jgi:hypothetical protein
MSLIAVALVALAGCGGGGKSKPPIGKPGHFSAKAGLLGNAASAGTIKSYVPTGKIVADDGFRPTINGFAFENYGNDAGPVNLTPGNVEDLFGPQVCATGTGNSCKLIPPARQWMDQENAAMAGGHCMGFSVTALRFFAGNLSPSNFGASQTVDLAVQGNTSLQSTIAEDWAYQSLPSVRRDAITGSPVHVLRALVDALNSRREQYTLAIVKADGTGGHAITPFAVEDKGGGRFEILVYDNNFPGVVRAVDVNTVADTWHYVGGINPSDTSEIYDGNAQTRSMLLFPTTPGEGTQPCPFCAPSPRSNPNPAEIGPSRDRFIEVALAGNTTEHPHLLFVDPKTGEKTGYTGGRLVQQIPGILVNQNFAVQDWSSSPEPTYDIQFGHPVYEVVVDGSNLKHAVTEKITVNGAGVLFIVANIHIAPGQKDTMLLPSDDLGLTYASYSSSAVSPLIAAEFGTYTDGVRFNVLQTALLGYAPGSPFTLRIDPKSSTALVGSPGRATPLYARAAHLVWLDSYPIKSPTPEHAYRTVSLKFNANTQLAQFSYLNPHGPALSIQIVDQSGHRVASAAAPPTAGGLGPR